MLSPIKPKRAVSQASLKEVTCHGGCGAIVQYRTTPRVYCPACRSAILAERARVGMEKQRRKRGIPKIKGTVIACEGCGAAVTLNRRADTRFCRSCYLAKNGAEARERSAAKRATPEGRDYLNRWHRKEHASNPRFAISARMRVLIHRGIGKGKAGLSWSKFVPYTLDELMRHLERQFLPGMTWENRGLWHIDHVVPVTAHEFSGPDDPEFKAAWALTNLQPLWALDNIRKNATRTHLL